MCLDLPDDPHSFLAQELWKNSKTPKEKLSDHVAKENADNKSYITSTDGKTQLSSNVVYALTLLFNELTSKSKGILTKAALVAGTILSMAYS